MSTADTNARPGEQILADACADPKVEMGRITKLLTDPRIWKDPYPCYRRLREQSPVVRTADDWWILSRFRDCDMVLRDRRAGRLPGSKCMPETDSGEPGADGTGAGPGKAPAPSSPPPPPPFVLDFLPDRGKGRDQFVREVAPGVVKPFEARFVEIANTLLAGAVEAGEVDLMRAFCLPYPTRIMAELMGVPDADCEQLMSWAPKLMRAYDPTFEFARPEEHAEAGRMSQDIASYVASLVAERRRNLGDDLLSRVIRLAENDEEPWTEMRTISLIVGFLALSTNTTTTLLANGVIALATHPGELARLRANPAAGVAGAVEEFLRYDSPSTLVTRLTHHDIALDGYTIPADEKVFVIIPSANRDSDEFPDPDRLDLTRKNSDSHLSFGQGGSYCLGAPLARIAARIAFTALVEQVPGLVLAGEPTRTPTLIIRSVESLPVRLR